MTGLLVGAEADLWSGENQTISSSSSSTSQILHALLAAESHAVRLVFGRRTEGMAVLPLNRLRTRLSIPLGLRHDRSTHLKRSLW